MRRWMFFTQADCVTIGTQVMREVRMFDEKLLNKAEALYIRYRLDEAFPLFMELAGAGCGRAMYFLGEYYNHGLGSIKDRNETEARYWHGKGAAVGELLSQLNQITTFQTHGKWLDFLIYVGSLMEKRKKVNTFALMPIICAENPTETI